MGEVCAPEPEDVRAGLVLFDYWLDQSDRVKAHLGDISDRSRLFGNLREHYLSLFKEMELGQREGVELLKRGDREGAWNRLNGLWMALPVVTLQLNYAALASHGEDARMVTTDWLGMLGDMNRRTAPLLEAALHGFDRQRMEVAAREHRSDLAFLQENLPRIRASLAKGADWTRVGLLIADGVTLAVGASDAVGLLDEGASAGPRLAMRFPGLASSGGAAAGVVVLPVEVLESLQDLVSLGALSTAILSTGMTLMVGKPEAIATKQSIQNQRISDNIKKIAKELGLPEQRIRDAIHEAKRAIPRSTAVKNPDVFVDLDSGEIYPKTTAGYPSSDSIGNIHDFLP